MARKRMIHPEIWESAEGWSCELFTVWICCITKADDEGRGRISALKKELCLMISLEDIDELLSKLEKNESIKIYCSGRYYFIPKWLEYQQISHPKQSTLPDPPEKPKNDTGIIPEVIRKDSGQLVNQVSLTSQDSLDKPVSLGKDSGHSSSSGLVKRFAPTELISKTVGMEPFKGGFSPVNNPQEYEMLVDYCMMIHKLDEKFSRACIHQTVGKKNPHGYLVKIISNPEFSPSDRCMKKAAKDMGAA